MPSPSADELTIATADIANSLDLVSQVIKQCADRIRNNNPYDLQSALQIMLQTADTPGCKIVFTGVGKSYLIGKKLAATLTSVGTPAISLHSTEALHGDLGIIHPGDCVVALSYSGATEEVLRLASVLRGVRSKEEASVSCGNTAGGAYLNNSHLVRLVGMGKSAESPLGQICDAWIESAVEMELSPLVKAPTSSSSLMLAIGDAIAIMMMKRRHFGPVDFARNHPGGHLGVVSREIVRQQELEDALRNTGNLG
ncbi:hypothetical protein LPJ66_003873 [Kickxella alabastrina]|uniref:Uncharacterized protein n=1 Tax=Kickxella alabastrina TaxID=61397 RepID=A0ACC1IIW1_9FUNG|nr:hypothetical protein LPJ66_003873 [Kickxella alabastrina]